MSPLRSLGVALLALLLSACSRTFLPSFAMEVELSRPTDTASLVLAEGEAYLRSRGYIRRGKDGYDEIHGTENSVAFELADKIDISFGLDRVGVVPIRVSYDGPGSKNEAEVVFNGLKTRLALRWPHIKEVP